MTALKNAGKQKMIPGSMFCTMNAGLSPEYILKKLFAEVFLLHLEPVCRSLLSTNL